MIRPVLGVVLLGNENIDSLGVKNNKFDMDKKILLWIAFDVMSSHEIL